MSIPNVLSCYHSVVGLARNTADFRMKSLTPCCMHLLAAFILCSGRVGSSAADRSVDLRTDFRQSEDASQSYFFYQQSEYPRDCQQVLQRCSPSHSSGVHVIKPIGYPEPFEVHCDYVGSCGWTVIQRRVDGLVNFRRPREEYKYGFGFLSNDHWLGNTKLSYMTNQAVYELRVDIELSNGSSLYVTYSNFRISDERDGYKIITIGNFSFGGDGSITYCPRNMIYGICTCGGTCDEPNRPSSCYTGCELGKEGCFCPDGYLMNGGECVPQSECSCYWSEVNSVVPNGQSLVNEDCTKKRNCTNSRLLSDDGYRCNSDAENIEIRDESTTSCPRNMIYGNCTCGGTCDEPNRPSSCYLGCEIGTEGCFCPVGFLMNGDECVPQSECSCYWSEVNSVVPNGRSVVNEDCTKKRNCANSRLLSDGRYRCDSNAECTTRDGVRQCYCNGGYEGNGRSCVIGNYRDCQDVYDAGHEQDGVYAVLPTNWPGDQFDVPCVMSNGGGWTVFQRRTGRNGYVDFYRDWASYREGFGSLDGDFWLGNEKIHYLTTQRNYKLHVDIVSYSNSATYAEYLVFRTASESDKYRLSVSRYNGSAGNSMSYANGRAFSTYDRDNDECGTHNCAVKHRGAWWHANNWCSYQYYRRCDFFNFGGDNNNTLCTASNLNGDYYGGNGQNINWNYNYNCNLNSVEMKIRPPY